MPRPLISKSLSELTKLHLEQNNKADQLSILNELGFRKTKGARKLAATISAQLGINNESLDIDLSLTTIRKTNSSHSKTVSAASKSVNFVPVKPKYSLTEEQSAAVDHFNGEKNLKITAFAGTGKTSTLVAMAGATPRRGLYLAFNKSIALEAKTEFPICTDCRTTHSVALRSVKAGGKYRDEKMFSKIGPKQLAEELKLTETAVAGKVTLTGTQQAHMMLSAIRNYCQSEDDTLSIKHVRESGRLLGLEHENKLAIKNWISTEANTIWKMMCDPENPISLGHDGYLKIWSISNPVLEHDYIFLDEAQDTNPAVVKVLKKQSAQLILVGDSHQQIYAWRGAVDAMDEFDTEKQTFLTKSFRFGETLAQAASAILKQLGENNHLSGNQKIITEIVEQGAAQAILTRTNSSVIEETISAIDNNLRPHIIGGNKETLQLIRAVYDLGKGIPSSHPDFFGFNNWAEVVEFAESEEGEQIKSFVTLVQQHGAGKIYRALKSSEDDESNADVIISTAHKAKGRQWQSVKIAYDFGSIKTETGDLPTEEIRLFYVAITRAQEKLIIPSALLNAYQTGVF